MLALVSLGLALGVCEVILRNVGGILHERFADPDMVAGWSLRPSFAGWVGGENVFWMTINADGMRDDEHPRAAPPHTTRVAVLGDSYIEGINVTADKTFTAFLERRLADCVSAPRRVDVLNFGVSGYGTAQEWIAYSHRAAKYRPDIVILALYAGNDIYNNHRRLNPVGYPELSPYFTLSGDRLVLDPAFQDAVRNLQEQPLWRQWRIAVTDRVRVAQLAHNVYGELRSRVVPGSADDAVPEAVNLDEAIYSPPADGDLADAWRVTEAIVLAWAAEVRRDGAEPWLVTLATDDQIEPEPDARRQFQAALGVADLYYPDRRLQALAARNGIPAVSLAAPMADFAVAERTYLNGGYTPEVPLGDGHWNEQGNQLAADLTARRLCGESAALAAVPGRR